MNTIRNYCEQFSSIDWNKQTRENLLPSTAGLATGTLINYDNPTAYAVSYLFRCSIVSVLSALDAGSAMERLTRRFTPSIADNPLVFPIGCNILLNLSASLASCQLSNLAGYPVSTPWALTGSLLGFGADLLVARSLAEDPFAKSEIPSITKDTFQKEVLESDLPVVVDAYGSWCPPCKYMLPIFTEASQEWAGKVKFVKLNISEEKELAEKLNIQAVPTFIFFKEGQAVAAQRGVMPKEFFGQQFAELFGIESK